MKPRAINTQPTVRRIAVIGIAMATMAAMFYVPPWVEYQVHLRDPLEPVVEYELLPTYAWRDQPPPSQRQGHGYSLDHDLLLLQMLAVGLIAGGLSYGVRGLIGVGAPVAGAWLGTLAPLLVIGEPAPHTAGVPTAVYVIMGITGLIGLAVGGVIAWAIIRSLPAPRAVKGRARGESE